MKHIADAISTLGFLFSVTTLIIIFAGTPDIHDSITQDCSSPSYEAER